MAIDFGATNTTLYYSIADSSDLTFPDGDWFLVFGCTNNQSATTSQKILFGTNGYGAASSNHLTINTSGELTVKYNGNSTLSAATAMVTGTNYICYMTRRSGNLYVGYSAIGSGSITESSAQDISTTSIDGADWIIGASGTIGTSTKWKGIVEFCAFGSTSSISQDEVIMMSSGAPVLSVAGSRLKRLWHWQTATATEPDIITGQLATRNGTGWTDAEDRSAIYVYDPYTYPLNAPVPILIGGVPGSISLSALQSKVSVDIVINGVSGSISLTGQQSEIIQAHHIYAVPGGIAISGLQGNVIQAHHINATPDQISLTSEQSHISLGMIIDAVSAGISISALQAVLPVGVLVSTVPGGISITGLQASISLGTTIDSTPAEISITGISGSTSHGMYIDASPDSLLLSGVAANVGVSMIISSTAAEIAIAGEQSAISLGGEPIIVNAISGTVSISTLTGRIIYGSIALIPSSRIIGIHRDNRIIGVTERGKYVN